MASSDSGKRLWSLGLFVLPLVAVKVASMMLGGSRPREAGASLQGSADTSPATTTEPAVAKVEWTEAQVTAAAHVVELASISFGPTPMYHVPTPVIVKPEPKPEPVTVAAPTEEPLPTFALHAVMTGPGGNKAVINGRAFQSGEEVDRTGWIIGDINIDDRSVTLQNPKTQGLMVITVQRPR